MYSTTVTGSFWVLRSVKAVPAVVSDLLGTEFCRREVDPAVPEGAVVVLREGQAHCHGLGRARWSFPCVCMPACLCDLSPVLCCYQRGFKNTLNGKHLGDIYEYNEKESRAF